MSFGFQLLRALVDSGSRTAIRQIGPELFTDEERPAYDFLSRFYRQHGQIPSLEVLADNGIRLIPASDPVSYYIDRCRQRAIGNVLQAEHPNFVHAFGRRDIEQARVAIERMRLAYSTYRERENVVSIHEARDLVAEDYQLAMTHPGLQGISTGWEFLDQKTSGFTPGDVWALVARPGKGKSYTMIWFALQAWLAGYSVLFVTMEMTVLQTARRMFSMFAGVNPRLVRRGQLDMYYEPQFRAALDDVVARPPFWFAAGNLEQSVSKVDAMVQEYEPDLVLADAAYLLEDEKNTSRSSAQEKLANVIKSIKAMALARNKPVVISVQLNREASKSRSKGKSDLDNIYGSDWIGQIASVVMTLGEGPPGSEKTKRIYKVVKSREDEDNITFVTNYLFQPFDMSFCGQMMSTGEISMDGRTHGDRLQADMVQTQQRDQV